MRTTFAGFVFDSDTRQVYRGDDPVEISPKAFELLDLLIRNRPRALPKSEIHDHLWPKTFVSDASLSNLVAELRAVLEDDAENPRLLRTVRRFGYAFIGEPSLAPDARPTGARQRLVWETREIPLTKGETLFGRDEESRVWIDDAAVSRRHARIVVEDGAATIEDLGSKNGTFVNGDPVESPFRLSDGDRIKIGRASIVFRETSPTRSTQTAHSSQVSGRSAASGRRRK